MNVNILNTVRNDLVDASAKGVKEIWLVYDALIQEHGNDWQFLSAISIVSAELFHKNASKGNEEYTALFQTINEMVFDYANRQADEIKDYSKFMEHYCQWISMMPVQ